MVCDISRKRMREREWQREKRKRGRGAWTMATSYAHRVWVLGGLEYRLLHCVVIVQSEVVSAPVCGCLHVPAPGWELVCPHPVPTGPNKSQLRIGLETRMIRFLVPSLYLWFFSFNRSSIHLLRHRLLLITPALVDEPMSILGFTPPCHLSLDSDRVLAYAR